MHTRTDSHSRSSGTMECTRCALVLTITSPPHFFQLGPPPRHSSKTYLVSTCANYTTSESCHKSSSHCPYTKLLARAVSSACETRRVSSGWRGLHHLIQPLPGMPSRNGMSLDMVISPTFIFSVMELSQYLLSTIDISQSVNCCSFSLERTHGALLSLDFLIP